MKFVSFTLMLIGSLVAPPISADEPGASFPSLDPPRPTRVTVADGRATLQFTAPAGAEAVTVYRSTERDDGYESVGELPATASSFEQQGLTNGTRYYFRLQASGDGHTSRHTPPLAATPRELEPTHYVDSSHTGPSRGTVDEPWQKLGQVKGLAPGDVIALKSGSVFREQFNVPVDGLAIVAYGDGPKPVVNGGEPASEWQPRSRPARRLRHARQAGALCPRRRRRPSPPRPVA